MQQENLLTYKENVFSQGGEDGIIATIFKKIGIKSKACLEVGAWDGVRFSNCRKLILDGWRAVMIEGDPNRFNELISNFKDNPLVICVNKYIDDGIDRLDSILKEFNISNLDFISIDIDGLDYEILETLEICPRVICIEAEFGHDPRLETRVPRDIAKNNVGQPLEMFVRLAEKKGYNLVCYTGNALFVRRDTIRESSLPALSAEQAYIQRLNDLSTSDREYQYIHNLGMSSAHYKFNNPHLSRRSLGIGIFRASRLVCRERYCKYLQLPRKLFWGILGRFSRRRR